MSLQCRACRGTGLDQRAVADAMRHLRETRGVSMRKVADLMELSPSYLSDLETGRRGWSVGLMAAFVNAVMKRSTT